MKQAIILTLLLAGLSMVQGQTPQATVYYTNKGSRYFFYLSQQEQTTVVYRFLKYLDKAGTGPSLLYTDTLALQQDNNEIRYVGQRVRLTQTHQQWQLHFTDGTRNKTLALYPITDTNQVNTTLNHAYWLDHFVAMSKAINDAFPLYHYSFRGGFGRWESLGNKTMHPTHFSLYADRIIKGIQDSVVNIQSSYAATTDYLIQHLATMDYPALKDSLLKLPDNLYEHGRYLTQVANALAINRPEQYFQLAEDLPAKQSIIFDAVYDKALVKKLKAYPTHSPAKKAFIKRKKSDRNSLIGSLAAGIAGAALLGYSIYVLTR
jgi:hypothetical protein